MNFRDELARIIAGDPRYSIEAYAFVLERSTTPSTRSSKRKGMEMTRKVPRSPSETRAHRHPQRKNLMVRAM